MSNQELKTKRVMEGIPARLLAARSRVAVSRLSDIERGYCQPSEHEAKRLEETLNKLIAARHEVEAVAERVGWPVSAL
jgi:ribosome-binding protein aMBF1 (putative translation factor)